ncbi:MAG: LPS export ABC transporter periplasmic protein LptC [Alphaproteobacteria bacterium]|nr:LPS export ABC transporter periplasmic protein LptC [Alphaproteobacteria bacterium]MCB9975310.1 LPS export ABC transporter periplasmic protein LptC [Rhodospirillales bacterium]
MIGEMETDKRDRGRQSFAKKQAAERIERLSRRESTAGQRAYGASYTKFVRTMRLVLPLIAAGIVMVLFLWPGGREEAIMPVQENEARFKDHKIVKNELLNPEFESTDKKNRPYKIRADRAVQGEQNEDLIMLEKPVGVMTMENGSTLQVTSKAGAYRRDTERFFLTGDVDFIHDDGYRLRSAETHIDFRKKIAWTEKEVTASGPDVTILAMGMKADNEKGELVFTGPAKLVLDKGLGGLGGL